MARSLSLGDRHDAIPTLDIDGVNNPTEERRLPVFIRHSSLVRSLTEFAWRKKPTKRLLAVITVPLLTVGCSDQPTVPNALPPSEIPPVRASLTPVQLQKLVASDAAAGDQFGWAVAVRGDVALFGAPDDDDDRGSAYVFRSEDGIWSQEAKLVASDRAAFHFFGLSVGVDGDVAVVGAYGDDDDAGSAYVFRATGGVWSQVAKLVAAERAAGDFFGSAVAVSGDVIVVGAPRDDDDAGSAWVFRATAGVWSPVAKLVASDAAAGDRFGTAVALGGELAVVGAEFDEHGGINSGSAYVFRPTGDDDWREEAKLVASDAGAGDGFGFSVALSGELAVVGADFDDDAGFASGAAYVFRREGGIWRQEAKLVPTDHAADDHFGRSVAASGDFAMVGADEKDETGINSGSAYVFRYEDGTWRQEAKLVPSDAATGDHFGNAVGLSGEVAVVGAFGDEDAGHESGSAYVFELLDPLVAVIEHVIDEVESLVAGSGITLAEELEDAIRRLEIALDALGETPPDHRTALKALEQAVDLLETAVSDGLLDPVDGAAAMDELAGAARDIAVAAIDDAIARGGNPHRIDEAEAELLNGDSLRAAGHFTSAVDKYKDAFISATRA